VIVVHHGKRRPSKATPVCRGLADHQSGIPYLGLENYSTVVGWVQTILIINILKSIRYYSLGIHGFSFWLYILRHEGWIRLGLRAEDLHDRLRPQLESVGRVGRVGS